MGMMSKAAVGRYAGVFLVIASIMAVPTGSADITDEILAELVQARPPCQGGAPPDADPGSVQSYANDCSSAAVAATTGAGGIIVFFAIDNGQAARQVAENRVDAATATAGEAADDALGTAGGLADQAENRVRDAYCSSGGAPVKQATDCYQTVVGFVKGRVS